jgi:hypothetical protein
MVPGQPVWAQGALEESGWPCTGLSLVGAVLWVAFVWPSPVGAAAWALVGLGLVVGGWALAEPMLIRAAGRMASG